MTWIWLHRVKGNREEPIHASKGGQAWVTVRKAEAPETRLSPKQTHGQTALMGPLNHCCPAAGEPCPKPLPGHGRWTVKNTLPLTCLRRVPGPTCCHTLRKAYERALSGYQSCRTQGGLFNHLPLHSKLKPQCGSNDGPEQHSLLPIRPPLPGSPPASASPSVLRGPLPAEQTRQGLHVSRCHGQRHAPPLHCRLLQVQIRHLIQ